ncbi:hypothetical protein [Bifidobacterium callitrichidarum]|nr:hypothetical protein [Bifidobacterium callitrichidarum]
MTSMFLTCMLAIRPDRKSARMRVWRLLAPVTLVTALLRIVSDVLILQSADTGKPNSLVIGLFFLVSLLIATGVLGNTPIETPTDNPANIIRR